MNGICRKFSNSIEFLIRSILYLGAANKLYWPNANMTLGACRAYFQLNGITVADVANAQMFIDDDGDNGDNEATEITTTNYTNLTNYSDAWYTLDGRRINGKPTQKGVYINGGRKVVIK